MPTAQRLRYDMDERSMDEGGAAPPLPGSADAPRARRPVDPAAQARKRWRAIYMLAGAAVVLTIALWLTHI